MIGTIGKYEIHPLCMLFPWMDREVMEALKEDIKKYGQRDSIKRYKNQILDGKNRLRALTELDLEPIIEDLPEDTNIIAYVKAVGLCRRDLTPTNRIIIAEKLDSLEQEQQPEEIKKKIAQQQKDPEKKKILEKQKNERIAKAAKSTIETVEKVRDIEKKAKKDPKAKKALDTLINENVKSVSKVHKDVIGEVKKKKSKTHVYTRAELEEQIRESEITIKRLENLNSRLITYIKEKGFWDEIKHEFGVVEMTPSSESTPKQQREAELL